MRVSRPVNVDERPALLQPPLGIFVGELDDVDAQRAGRVRRAIRKRVFGGGAGRLGGDVPRQLRALRGPVLVAVVHAIDALGGARDALAPVPGEKWQAPPGRSRQSHDGRRRRK